MVVKYVSFAVFVNFVFVFSKLCFLVMTRPTLSGPRIIEQFDVPSCTGSSLLIQRFAFFCEIGYDRKPIDDGARFIVRILFNDVPSDAEFRIATSLDTVMEISEVHLARQMGKRVMNNVDSRYVYNRHI